MTQSGHCDRLLTSSPDRFYASSPSLENPVRRREFIGFLGGALAWRTAARAQQNRIPVVGYVGAQSRSFYDDRLRAFDEGLREIGIQQYRDVLIEYRWAEGHVDRLPALLSELVAQRVDLIALPDSIAGSIAAKRMFSTVPIVFGIAADPVELGLVEIRGRILSSELGTICSDASSGFITAPRPA
jgi:putative ABC transport system substrate-binding protein